MLASCNADKEPNNTGSQQRHEQELKVLSQKLTDAEANGQLKEFLRPFDTDALCMPEYQVTLTGDKEIASYYEEMFKRQHIKTLHRQQQEFIHMKNTIVEIGTFKKEYTTSDVDSLITLEGKYWHVWSVLPNGMYRIKGEAFGYFHSVDLPESLVISTDQRQPGESELNAVQPFELKAYNALMEKGVLRRHHRRLRMLDHLWRADRILADHAGQRGLPGVRLGHLRSALAFWRRRRLNRRTRGDRPC
jgi:hypothetical protein